MRTSDHLPPPLPRPQTSAASSREPMTPSKRPRSTIYFDPVSSDYVTTDTIEVLPQIGYFQATPPRPRKAPAALSEIIMPKPTPTDWIYEDEEDEIMEDQPGHAAYYKSSKFLHKVAAGKVQIPGGAKAVTMISNKDTVKLYRAQAEPLVMIFGLNNVRRARAEKKSDSRLQKHNRRA